MNNTLLRKKCTTASISLLVALLGASCTGTSQYEDSVSPAEPGAGGGPPSSTPARRDEVKTIPAGTVLNVRLEQAVSTAHSKVGDPLSGRLAEPVVVGGDVVLDANSIVHGRVVESSPAPKIGGRARLNLVFSSIDDEGREVPITGMFYSEGKGQTKKDAATIGGATAGGAVLGRVIGHDSGDEAKGTAIGAVVGAAVGTAVAAKNKAAPVTLPADSVIQIVLEAPATVVVS